MSVASYINYHRAPFTKFMSISEYNEKHQAHIPQNAEFEAGFRAALADARRVTDPHDYVQHHFNVEEMKLRTFGRGRLGNSRSGGKSTVTNPAVPGASTLGNPGTVSARGRRSKCVAPNRQREPRSPTPNKFNGNPSPSSPASTTRRGSSASAPPLAAGTPAVTPSAPPAGTPPAVTPSAPPAPLSEEEKKTVNLIKWQLKRIWFSNKGNVKKLSEAKGMLTRIIKKLQKLRQFPKDVEDELDDLIEEADAKLKPELKPAEGSPPPIPGPRPTGFMDSDEEEEVSPMDVEDTTLGVEDISLDDVLDEYGEEAEHYEEATTGVSSLHEEIDTYLKSNAKDDASFARDRAHVVHFNTVSTHLPARLMKGRDRYMKRLKAYLDGDTSAKVRMMDNTEVLVSALSPNLDSLRALLKASSGEPRFCECA